MQLKHPTVPWWPGSNLGDGPFQECLPPLLWGDVTSLLTWGQGPGRESGPVGFLLNLPPPAVRLPKLTAQRDGLAVLTALEGAHVVVLACLLASGAKLPRNSPMPFRTADLLPPLAVPLSVPHSWSLSRGVPIL